jgi:hypothetical protein
MQTVTVCYGRKAATPTGHLDRLKMAHSDHWIMVPESGHWQITEGFQRLSALAEKRSLAVISLVVSYWTEALVAFAVG